MYGNRARVDWMVFNASDKRRETFGTDKRKMYSCDWDDHGFFI